MLSFAWKEISRRRARAALSIAGFLLVALLLSAGQSLGRAIREATEEPLKVSGADLVVTRTVKPCALATVKRPKSLGAITGEEIQHIEALEGVKAVTGSLVVWAFHDGQPTVVTGIDPDKIKSSPLRQYQDGERCCMLEEGRLFDPDKNETVLDKAFADDAGVGVGDMIPLGLQEFEVVGLLKVAGVAVIAGGQAYVNLETVQVMLGEGDAYDYVFITTQPEADIQLVTDQINAIIGEGCEVSSRDSLPSKVSRAAAMAAQGTGVFVGLILVVGALLMIRTALSSVHERVVEIGIMRAVGWRKGHIVRLLGTEMTLQGLIGAVPGVILGYGIAYAICTHLSLSLPSAFNSYPPCATTEPALKLTLAPAFHLGGVAVSLVLTIALAVITGLWAGRHAASRPPMESLRQP
ncbi:MAG: ABC transporter permease [Victivallales bacterium]|nr:ABC transporter permease [Victivallales bacterium]